MDKFDVVLIEKECGTGFTINEIQELYKKMNHEKGYPIEIYNNNGESSAMGFISESGYNKCAEDPQKILENYIGEILGDMNLENDSHTYIYDNLVVYLTRNI